MSIRIARHYPYPRTAVWQALTDARAIRQWWVDTDFVPEPGRRFFFQDVPQRGWDGRVTGEVLEVEAGRRVRFTWHGGGHDTIVTYLLEDDGGGTRLTLLHEGFRGIGGLMLSVMLRFGWRSLVNEILPATARDIAAHGVAHPFTAPSKAARRARAA